MRTKLTVLTAAVLLLGACSTGGDDTPADPTAPDAPTATDGTAAPVPTAGATPPAPPEAVSADLPDGVAASVGDVEIGTEELAARFDLVVAQPEIQQQLETGDGEQIEAQLNSQILSQLIVQEAVVQGAAEEGIEVTDEQVAEERAELVETVGGEEALAERMAQAGIPESELEDDLRAGVAFEQVGEALVEQGEAPTTGPSPAPSGAPDPVQMAQQQWLMELLTGMDIVVDESLGGWDATTGSVVPA